MEINTWFSGSGKSEDKSLEWNSIHSQIKFDKDLTIDANDKNGIRNIDIMYDKLPEYNDSTSMNNIHPDNPSYRATIDKYTYRVSNDLNDIEKHKQDIHKIIDTYFDLFKEYNINE